MSVKQSAAKVYVVDDDAAVRNSIKLLVQAFGFQAESYPSAEAFLDAYKPDQPGCLVLDLHMPNMNGVELQQRLTALGVSIPVIIVTATPDHPFAFLAKEAGALAILAKPVKADELKRGIQQALTQAN
jgi:FixJ family two-component response regulator